MGRLTEYFGLLESKDLEEDKILCSYLDLDKVWPIIIEDRKLLRELKKQHPEPRLF